MNELTKAFVLEYKQMKECEEIFKANTINWENYFNYSGEIEKSDPKYAEYEHYMQAAFIKAQKIPATSRKEYFKEYWLKYKLNRI